MSRRDAAGSVSSSCRPPRLLELGIRGMSPARRGVWKRCVGAGGTGCGRCAAATGVLGVAGGLGLRALGVRRPSSLWMAGRAGTCRGGTLPAARARAAGRRGGWSRGPGPSPRHGPRRGPRGQQPRARGAADGWKLSKGGGRGGGGTTGPRRGGDVWAGDRRGTCRGGAASCRRRAASSWCRGDSGSRRGRTAPPASCGRGHRGVWALAARAVSGGAAAVRRPRREGEGIRPWPEPRRFRGCWPAPRRSPPARWRTPGTASAARRGTDVPRPRTRRRS